ncbi:MAG: VCBS repeat-containing protein [Pyrinomonadaceae bacterium]|nr:VCBS repeat-containing protein [Pyrinomonadaceae bacterium]
MKNYIRFILLSSFALLVTVNSTFAAPVIRSAAGANAAAIQATVDQFRADLGGALNPNNGQSFTNGRREINWDGVPDTLSSPNNLPANFFNSNSPRGAVFTTACGNATFRVSSTTASGTPVRFGELDASYTNTFTTFSAQRLFTVISESAAPCSILTVNFFIPGTSIPATVSGFGIVLTDVDTTGNARIIAYDKGGNIIAPGFMAPPAANGGLSFVGVSYTAGERIASVQIVSGTNRLAAGNIDGTNGVDAVAMDDFIYGEPRATEHHSSDFDGDGTSDLAVFRPSIGTWFFINSGSNTFSGVQFGQNGDVPIDGDFDGDSRNDIAVFRPSSGFWFVLNSSNGAFNALAFGQSGDKPVPGDYDKDGKTDIAVWRPSSGFYFRLNSSNGQFQASQFGQNGDIPINSSLVP